MLSQSIELLSPGIDVRTYFINQMGHVDSFLKYVYSKTQDNQHDPISLYYANQLVIVIMSHSIEYIKNNAEIYNMDTTRLPITYWTCTHL